MKNIYFTMWIRLIRKCCIKTRHLTNNYVRIKLFLIFKKLDVFELTVEYTPGAFGKSVENK